jgi:hypothetical protein
MAYEVEQENEMTDSFFETPEISVPASSPDAHRAVITSVTTRHLNNDKQTAIISIGLTSRDVPTLETALDIFVPKGYEENIALGSKFDASTLPEQEGDKQQTSFRLGIANSEKTAALQRYVFNTNSIARRAGRDPIELGLNPRAKTLDEYVDNINKMLQGVEVIFLRRERGGDDPAFKHQLNVRDIVSSDEFETNPKRFKKYVLAWESGN